VETDPRLVDLLVDWEESRRRGTPPSLEELCGDRPDLLAELRRRIEALRDIDSVLETESTGLLPTPGQQDAGAMANGGILEVPVRIGKYRIVRSLGTGGQASALLAYDPDLCRHIVLKRYHAAAAPVGHEAALREGQALARLRSPYVARCLGLERVDLAVYLVIEYVPGDNLARYKDRFPLGSAAAAALIERLAEGLAAVHACGLLHRDIKPSNILIGHDGIPRLVDFGLAVPLTSAALSGISGTPLYMAPEQARGEPERIDPRSDVFGLGAVLYELLTGRPPYRGKSREEVLLLAQRCQYEPPRRVRPGVPRRLEQICLKAMAAAPEQRYASASELQRALRRYRRWSKVYPVGAVAAVVLPLLLTVPLLLAPASEGRKHKPRVITPSSAVGSPPVSSTERTPETPRIVSLEIGHWPRGSGKRYDADRVGTLGIRSFSTRLDDDLTVRAELSEPAYSYLLAFRTDGVVEVCDPDDEDTAPTRTDHPQYPPPSKAGKVYRLSEGHGLHAFALIVSRGPLPPFRAWQERHGKAPWGRGLEADPGVVWRHDGRWLVPWTAQGQDGVRGRGQEARGGGSAVARLANWLRGVPGVDDVLVEAFAVETRDVH
jgi:serine/threonine protein kinase